MAVDDPNAPWSPWAVPPSTVDLDAELARAYGLPPPDQQQVLEGVFSPVMAQAVPTTVDPNQLPGADQPFQWNDKGPQPNPEPFDQAEADAARARGESPVAPTKGDFHNPSRPNPGTPLPGAAPRTDAARIGAFGAPWSGEELVAPDWGAAFDPDKRLSPEEEGQIEIDGEQKRLSPDEEAQIEIDGERAPAREAFAPTAEIPESYLSAGGLGERWSSSLSPSEQEDKRDEIEGARADFERAGMVNASTRALQEADDNMRAYKQSVADSWKKTALLDAEAKKLSEEKIDPLRDISVGQRILGVIAAFVGGFGAGKNGGRNIGMEAVDSMINDAISVQTANLNNRKDMLGKQRSAIAEQMETGKDLYHAQEMVRLATYDQLIKKLEAEAQQFDPRGTTALKRMDLANQAKQKREAWLAKYQADDQKRGQELIELQLKAVREDEAIRHNKASERTAATSAFADLTRAKASAAKDYAEAEEKAGSNVLLTPDELRARGINIPADAKVPPMSLVQAKKFAETAKSVEDWNKAARENSPEAMALEHGVENLTTEEGKPLQFKDSKKVATSFAAADDAVRLYDELITLREKYGGSSDLIRAPEWRQAHAKFAALLLNQKTRDELGALTGSDLGLESKKIGTEDPTEWRDPLPGLKEGRRNLVEGMNSMIRAQTPGQKPRRWEPPPPPPPPEKTPDDVQFQEVLGFTAGKPGVDLEKDLNIDPALPASERRQRSAEALRQAGGIPPSVRARIDRIVRAVSDPALTDEQRADANSKLQQLANSAESNAVREYALRAGAPNPAAAAQLSKD